MKLLFALFALVFTSAALRAQMPGYQWTNYAGMPGGKGDANASGSVARFNYPDGLATDRSGNLYVADRNNNAIRVITPAGAVTTFAGNLQIVGSANGTGPNAHFNSPFGMVVDSHGNLFVADELNDEIREITPGAVVTTFAGSAGVAGSNDGTGAAASFNEPEGIAIDANDNLYLADTGNNTIRMITPGAVVTTIAGNASLPAGSANGKGAAATFNGPNALCVSPTTGLIYVSDNANNLVRQITSAGVVTTLAGQVGVASTTDGTGTGAAFNGPGGMCFDSNGNILVCTTTCLRLVTPAGVVTTVAGSPSRSGRSDGAGGAAEFNYAEEICTTASGAFFIADTHNCTIRTMTPSSDATPYNVTTVAGLAPNYGSANGSVTAAHFNNPSGAVFDSFGNLYLADQQNNLIREITPANVVTTLAGSTTAGSTDGTGPAAQFNNPSGIAIDASNNLYVADSENDTIRMITTPGAVVTTIAGTVGVQGSADGMGTAATFSVPRGLAVDGSGVIWVADSSNNTIRRIGTNGAVTTFAGSAGHSGSTDGTGTGARFDYPNDIAIDGNGNLYVTDKDNNTIREISPSAVVTTLAGYAGLSGSADGNGAAARFYKPCGIRIDGQGYLYVTESANSTVRKISPAANVYTIGGLPLFGTSQDGVGSQAWFSSPFGLGVSSSGTVYVTDSYNNRISIGAPQPPIVTTSPATSIGDTAATLNGSVNPNGSVTTVYFQYGTTASYGQTVAVTLSPNDDLNAHPLSSVLSALPPQPVYHFRILATNNGGTANGADMTFDNAPVIDVAEPSTTALTTGVSTITYQVTATGNSRPVTFTVKNTGPVDLTGITASIDGANPAEFTAGTLVSSLASGNSATFAVTFKPTAVGVQSATLHVLSNDPVTPSFDIGLTGTGASARLSGLTIGAGTLSPGFSSGVTSYTASVPNATGSITLTPTLLDSTATVTVNGMSTASGSASDPVSLNVGSNVIPVAVTAQSNVTTLTYMVTVTRHNAPPSGLSYSANPAAYTAGVAIAPNTPSTSGGGPVSSYSVLPALPPDLSLNPSTGAITGIPAAMVSSGSYTVTATNDGGSTTDSVSISFNPGSILSFPQPALEAQPVNSLGLPNLVPIAITRTDGENPNVSAQVTAGVPSSVPAGTNTLVYGKNYRFVTESAPGVAAAQFSGSATSATVMVQLMPVTASVPGEFLLSLGTTAGYATVGSVSSLTVTVLPHEPRPALALTAPTKATVAATFDIAGTVKESQTLGALTVTLNGTPLTLTTDPTQNFVPNQPVVFGVTGASAENGANTVVVEAFDASGYKEVLTKTVTYVNVRPALAGAYAALIQPVATPANANSGLLSVTVTPTGAFTGKAAIAGLSLPIAGTLSNAGAARFKPALGASFTLSSGHHPLGALAFTVDASNGLAGTLSTTGTGGAAFANFAAQPAPYSVRNHVPAGLGLLNVPTSGVATRGVYTVAMPSMAQTPTLDPSLYPQGSGYAALTLKNTGSVTVAGALADGSVYSASGSLRSDGSVPLFTSLYHKLGFFMGELMLSTPSGNPAGYAFTWLCPPRATAAYYPAGWPGGIGLDVVAAQYTYPASLNIGQGAANVTTGNASLVFSDGGLSGPITDAVSIDPATGAVVLIPAATKAYKLSLTSKTGIFAGTFLHTDGKTDAYHGALINQGSTEAGFGFFLSPPAAGSPGSGSSGDVMLSK